MTINIELASKIGLKESLVITELKRIQDEQNTFSEGVYWAEVSLIQLCKIFPFFNESEIRRILSKLEDNNLIKSFKANTIRVAKRYHVKEN